MKTVGEYFEEWMGLVRAADPDAYAGIARKLRGLRVAFKVRRQTGGVEESHYALPDEPLDSEPAVTITASHSTLKDIVASRIDPLDALTTKPLSIRGGREPLERLHGGLRDLVKASAASKYQGLDDLVGGFLSEDTHAVAKRAPPAAPARPVRADVVVFGAGIAGLTVAHELAERNFAVAVFDPDLAAEPPNLNDPAGENPGVGGIARSQWGFLPVEIGAIAQGPFSDDLLPVRTKRKWEPITIQYAFADGKVTLNSQYRTARGELRTNLGEKLAEFKELLRKDPDINYTLRIVPNKPDSTEVLAVFAVMESDALGAFVARGEVFTGGVSVQATGTVVLDVNLFSLPGEHGFRFFPSFYRHVFDTMRRIPLMSLQGGTEDVERSTTRTHVFDNLIPSTEALYVGNSPGPSVQVPREKLDSIESARKLFDGILAKVGYSTDDLVRVSGAFLRYVTSSRQRREREYENVSWFDFVKADQMSARGRLLTQTTPSVLLALWGSESDARSQGTIATQLLETQTGDGTQSDMLLNGPTDSAWFGHWYRYLQTQGTQFLTGTLSGFVRSGDTVEPVVETPQGQVPSFVPVHDRIQKTRFVLAMPLLQASELARLLLAELDALPAASGEDRRDLRALCRFAGPALAADVKKPSPIGPLRHLTGIQYFFRQDLRLWKGHTQYVDAIAGLSAIAQPQFWQDPRDVTSGYRSILSVDVAIVAPPVVAGVPLDGVPADPALYAWGRDRKTIATSIWEQIQQGHEGDFPDTWPRLPDPFAYHIDDSLEFVPDGQGNEVLGGNKTPFLVCQVGRYRLRPGAAGLPSAKTEWRAPIGYAVSLGRYVVAGPHMQTFTRITSMEAACESGRHAVNALLARLDDEVGGLGGEACAIWDPEDYEPADLAGIKEIDDRLCSQGRPHVADILKG